jgi:putative SOS response-associated peptidase YedK
MPVILEPDSYDLWLDPGMSDVSAATDLLKPKTQYSTSLHWSLDKGRSRAQDTRRTVDR